MYNHFEFADGGSPYITTNNKALFRMVKKYFLEQTGPHTFTATPAQFLSTGRKLTDYEKAQTALREFACEWQYATMEFTMTWWDSVEWFNFFEEYGRKYGLLREFRENGIC